LKSNLRIAGSARGAEGVVAAADLDGQSGGQVDLCAVQAVMSDLLQVESWMSFICDEKSLICLP